MSVQQRERITLQVNVAPSDHWHIRTSLAHHMKIWGGQVDEILFSIDTVRSPGRRGMEWDEGRPKLAKALDEIGTQHPNVRAIEVDYSAEASAVVSEEFFGGKPVPRKDCFGAPFFAYLHGLHAASNQLVLHLDADMLFGGGSQTWLREAVTTLRAQPTALVCAPLPGPPTADGEIMPHIADRHRRTQRYGSAPIRQQCDTPTFAFTHMSTRVFLLDRHRFSAEVGALRSMRVLRGGYPRNLGHPPHYPLETVLSRAMHRAQLVRLNMLGEPPGMWYLHPPQRQDGLAEELPSLVELVERGEIPSKQRGDDQMNDSMFQGATGANSVAADSRIWQRIRRRMHTSTASGENR